MWHRRLICRLRQFRGLRQIDRRQRPAHGVVAVRRLLVLVRIAVLRRPVALLPRLGLVRLDDGHIRDSGVGHLWRFRSQGSQTGVIGPVFSELRRIRLRFGSGVGVPSLTGVGVIGRKACDGGIGSGAAGGR